MNINSDNRNTNWRTILWIVLPVLVIANVYLVYLSELSGVLLLGANTIYLSLLAWLTWRVTRSIVTEDTEHHDDRPRLWTQITVLLIVILLTGSNSNNIPLWSTMPVLPSLSHLNRRAPMKHARNLRSTTLVI